MPSIYYIDGYNVLHHSTELRSLVRQDLETAREGLIDKVSVFCMATGNQAHLVFDGRGLHQPERTPNHLGIKDFEVIYTPTGSTADAFIERAVYKAAHRLGLVVVSNDRSLRDLCRNMGALTMDADNFLGTVREARVDTSAMVAGTQRNTGLSQLEERLGRDTLERLEQLKQVLKQKKDPKR